MLLILTGGVYHHHFHSPCLQSKLNDTGTGHSPIYGFILDGYPIYGPYHSNNTLTKSCWKVRNYKSASTGCLEGKRSCVFKDPSDTKLGVIPLKKNEFGPHVDETLTTQSGNKITAVSGQYSVDSRRYYMYIYVYLYIYLILLFLNISLVLPVVSQ